MSKPKFLRSAAIGVAALALVGSHEAVAAPFSSAANVVTAAPAAQSQIVNVRSRHRHYYHGGHHHGGGIGAGIAIGTLGLIAGSALASNNYYGGGYYEPYYSYYPPPPVYYRRDYRPDYYPPLPPRYYAPRPRYYPYYPY